MLQLRSDDGQSLIIALQHCNLLAAAAAVVYRCMPLVVEDVPAAVHQLVGDSRP